MKVMVIVKASPSSEAGELPSTELLTAMGKYNEQLVDAGIMLAGEGLKASSQGVRVHFSGQNRTVIDGPFTETKELIAGFWLWRVSSLEEAIDWVKKCPNPMNEDSDIEIRPLFEADDFGAEFTPELREQEAALRAAGLGLGTPTFQESPERLIAGINATYTMDDRATIPSHWEHFAPHLGKVPGQIGTESYGVCWNVKPDCQFDYLTGVAVSGSEPLPPEFHSVKLEARRYAVFTHPDHVSKIPQTLATIWSKWVPDCGLKIAEAPCFERYTSEFNPQTGMGGMEIWIPISP
jgi:AraC family transcriptional regulator